MYTLLAIDQEEKKEVLGFYLSESDGANFWLGLLNKLKERGVEDILICVIRRGCYTKYVGLHIDL